MERGVRVEVLAKGVWGDHLVVGGNELIKFDGKEVWVLVRIAFP